MANINNKTIALPLLTVLLFLGGLVSAYPASMIHDSSYLVSIYARTDMWVHQNATYETFDALFSYSDSLKLWRFFSNCSSGC